MIAELALEHPAACGVVVEPPAQIRVTREVGVPGGADPNLADLRELVGREDRRRFRPRGGHLPAEPRLALHRVLERRILAHRLDQAGDERAEAHAQLDGGRVGALEDVVQKPRRHDVLGIAEHVQEGADLERMEEERRSVRLTKLTGVTLGRKFVCRRRGREPSEVRGRAMSLRSAYRHTSMTSTTPHLNTQRDRASFTASVERHRRELHVHCYRMLGSFEESEDLVQETFLRAWRGRETFEGRSSLRAWLYRIATNACLDALDKRPRAASASGEVLWLQPYPDVLLEELADAAEGPEAAVVSKETIELAYLVAIQRLAPLQRAVLILRDVLGCSARETAELLETTAPAVNSALQRARAAMKEHLPEQRDEWPAGTDATAAERELLERYVEYGEAGRTARPQAAVQR